MGIEPEKIRNLTDQIADIAKRNQAKVPTSKQAVVVSLDGDTTWVEFADATEQTPVERSTVRCQVGDVVTVQIVDGSAIITGNLSEKSVGASAVSAAVAPVSDEITVVKKLIAESATIGDLEATKARIGTLETEKANVTDLDAATARIGVLESTSATVENLSATNAKVESLEANKADITDLNATNAKVSDLEATRAKVTDLEATNAKVTNLEANKASVSDLEAANANIGKLDAAKANIDLANVNNAWIANGTIKDASISDAQILGVSANKLTAGTIDASKISVTNLNADNLTVGTINGKLIGNESIDLDKLSEEVPTKAQLDKAKEELQGQIDGNIETFTVSVVPTLNNSPASTWKDAATRKKHIGDVAYVVNEGSAQDGYAYRFGYDESSKTYGWVLIKDNDVTAALKRIADAEGSIDGLKSFETSTSKWIDQTDEGLTEVRSRTTTLETQMGDKVSSTTFKELADTVDEQSTTITTMSDTLSKKADGSAVTSLSQTVSQVKQTADGNSTKLSNLSKTVDTKADSSTVTTLTDTVNAVKKTADGNSTTISNLSKTVDTKADGSTVTKLSDTLNTVKQTADSNTVAITQTNKDLATTNTNVSQVGQDLSGFKTTVSTTYETKTAAAQTKSTLETNIKQTNDAVALKAAKTDLDAATKRLTTAETNITAANNQISLKASKTEVPGLVDVGGRNLLLGTGDLYATLSWAPYVTGTETIGGAKFIIIEPTKGTQWAQVTIYLTKSDVDGSYWDSLRKATVTVSFDMVSDTSISFSPALRGVKDTDGTLATYGLGTLNCEGDGKVHHLVTTKTLAITTKQKHGSSIYIYPFSVNKTQTGVFKIGNVKMEIGNVPTAWTPAPEDTESDIATAKQAAIDVSAEAIKSLVKSAGGEASYEQTDQGFTWTTTSPMTQVKDTTARTNANDAANAASKAQTTADAANSTANIAKETADSASKAAGEAETAAADAAKTATSFMDYNQTESGALTLGYRSGSTISTVRAVLSNAALSFKNTAGTVLGSFGATSAQVGASSAKNALINADGVFLRNATTNLASFQATQAQVGASGSKNLLMSSVGLYLRSGATNLMTLLADRIEMLGGKLMFGAKKLTERTISGMYSTDNIAIMSEKTESSGKAGVVEVGEGSASMNIDGTDYGIGIARDDAGKVNGQITVDNLCFGGMQLNADAPKHGNVQVTAESGADAMWAARGGKAASDGTNRVIKFGVGAGGVNRGIWDDKKGKWVIYWDDDVSDRPVIPGLYVADYQASSLKPNYSGYTPSKSLSAGSSTSGTLSYSLSGYGALGIIGVDVSQCTYPTHTLVNAWVTNRENGSAIIHYTIKNTTSSSANTVKVRFHVLVAKQ